MVGGRPSPLVRREQSGGHCMRVGAMCNVAIEWWELCSRANRMRSTPRSYCFVKIANAALLQQREVFDT